MTTECKISRLNSAVTDWRGKFHPETKKWIVPPKPSHIIRVKNWLVRLGRDPSVDLPRIQTFQKFEEFHAYLREVRQDIAKRNQPAEVEL
jgi:hypothetical protein